MLANLLAADEREAVLGDLAEARESTIRGVVAVLGLVARRQAALWLNWRPYLILVVFVVPAALVLHGIGRWDAGLFAAEALQKDLPWFARLLTMAFATLACWSFLGGSILRTIAPRTLVTQASAMLGVMIVAQAADLISHLTLAHHSAGEASAYGAVAPWLVQIVFVAGPLVWGMREPLPRIVILGVIFTVAEFACQRILRPYHFPGFVAVLAVYWPFAYVVMRIGKYGLRLSHRWS